MTTIKPPWQCFEDEVYEAVNKALLSGYISFNEDKAEVVRGAHYPGLTPGCTVKGEVALVAYRNGVTEPFLIWLWECKDKSNRKVEAGDVWELHSKLQEIGVSRAVGSLVTPMGFQRGAMDLAKKLGISLYLLKKTLEPHTKYETSNVATFRQTLFVEQTLDFSGFERTGMRFDEAVQADLGHLLTRMNRKTDSAAAWESLMTRIKERPIHGGGIHLTRDEMHERR